MADFSKFRSSLNGFNRSDVAAYIETLCAGHQKALKAAQEEAAELSRQLEEKTALAAALQNELDATQTALDSTQSALEEALDALTNPVVEEVVEEEPAPDYAEMELEAYRRAEAVERASTQRAAKLRAQLDEMLDQVSGRYEQTGQEIQVLTEDIRINLQRLEEALSDLDLIFDETKNNFDDMGEPYSTEE